LRVDQFVLENFHLRVVELELELQGPIGDPSTAAEQIDDAIEHFKEVHLPSLSPRLV
jgi:hypothetical protein